MQNIDFEAFSCKHFNFKNSDPVCARTTIFIQKIEKFSHPSLGASTLDPPLQNPRYDTGCEHDFTSLVFSRDRQLQQLLD